MVKIKVSSRKVYTFLMFCVILSERFLIFINIYIYIYILW